MSINLKQDPNNANKGTPRGAHAISESLKRLGAGRSIVADKDGTIIAGNQTYKQALELGLEPEFVHTTGDRLVVVVRDDLDLENDDGTALALALADNRTQELSLNFDDEQLMDALETGTDLTFLWRKDEQALFFDEEDTTEPLEPEDSASAELNRNIEPDDYDDSEDYTETEENGQVRVYMRPLPIVLDRDYSEKWDRVKESFGVKSDKLAFMKLVDEFLGGDQSNGV